MIPDRLFIALTLAAFLTLGPLTGCGRADQDQKIRLPAGFVLDVYARVPGARSMVLGPGGTLFVGTRGDKVYAVTDENGDGAGETVRVIARGLNSPNGVALRDGDLYVAEVSRILRFGGIEERLDAPPEPVVLRDDLPRDRHHGWKYIAFGPDGLLYVPVGAPCNVCERSDPRYAALLRMRPDGSQLEVFASGIRNTVGFAWHPETEALWFTNNGRDNLGDDLPPDTLNRAPRPGLHFGFPWCHAGDVPDPEFGARRSCAEFDTPALKLPAHVAPLGLTFSTGDRFPAPWRGRLFIAEHGSWNRSEPVGYRVTAVTVVDGRAVSYEPFATGWLDGRTVSGRPVDVIETPDGSLLVSDDHAGLIHRIRWVGP